MRNKYKNKQKCKRSFTLIELLLVIVILAILMTIALLILNPKKQIDKARDTRRKNNLTNLETALIEWYIQKDCYPKPDEICYKDQTSLNCYICGTNPNSPNSDFTSNLKQLPCDPASPRQDYLYQVDNAACPKWYRSYTILSSSIDGSYNYGIASSNTTLLPYPTIAGAPPPLPSATNTPLPPSPTPVSCPADPIPKYCLQSSSGCNECGSFSNCSHGCNPATLYIDRFCTVTCF